MGRALLVEMRLSLGLGSVIAVGHALLLSFEKNEGRGGGGVAGRFRLRMTMTKGRGEAHAGVRLAQRRGHKYLGHCCRDSFPGASTVLRSTQMAAFAKVAGGAGLKAEAGHGSPRRGC